MFKTVADVNTVSDREIVELVENGWNVDISSLVHKDELEAFREAKKLVSKYENMAEAMAYQVRDRFMEILDNCEDFEDQYGIDEGEANDLVDDFMNTIAGELGQNYNGEWEHRPDSFWVPSTC